MRDRLKRIARTLTTVRDTLASIAPYVFTRENASLLGLAGLAITSNFVLEFIVADSLSSTISFILLGGESTILGVEMGSSYGMIAATTTAYALRGYSISARNRLLAPLPPRGVAKLFSNYGKHILSASLEQQRDRTMGEAITDLQKGFGAMYSISGNLFSQGIPLLVGTPVTTGIICWRYGTTIGLGTSAVVVTSALYGMSTTDENAERREQSRVTGNTAFEELETTHTHTRTIQLNGTEAKTVKAIDDAHAIWKSKESKSLEYNAEVEAKINSITYAGLMLLLLKAAQRIANHELRGEDFPALYALLTQNFSQLSAMGLTFCQMVSSSVDLDTVFKHLHQSNGLRERKTDKPLEIKNNPPEIKFENVTFRFKNGKTGLDNMSCTFPAGKLTALVGASGSGKSTILNILTQFYDAEKGNVFIDGQNICSFAREDIRSHMSTVAQKPDLFHGSIEANIRRGVPHEISDAEVWDAIKQASLEEFVLRQKDGLKTDVGAGGDKLSGGEAQRVSIARALARKPKILFLDEATSALDEKTAKTVMHELKKVCETTTIMVTHRLSEARHAHQILFLKNGALAEAGTHDQLVSLPGGHYRALWLEQNKTPGREFTLFPPAPASHAIDIKEPESKAEAEPPVVFITIHNAKTF